MRVESTRYFQLDSQQSQEQRIRKNKVFKTQCELREKMSLSPQLIQIQNQLITDEEFNLINPALKDCTGSQGLPFLQKKIRHPLSWQEKLICCKLLRTYAQYQIANSAFTVQIFSKYSCLIDFLVEIIASEKDEYILIESTWALVNLAYDYSSLSTAKRLFERKKFVPSLLELINHPQLSIRMQAVWVFANCLSDKELEPDRHKIRTQTPLLDVIRDSLCIAQVQTFTLQIMLFGLRVLTAPFRSFQVRLSPIKEIILELSPFLNHEDPTIFKLILQILLNISQPCPSTSANFLVQLGILRPLIEKGFSSNMVTILMLTVKLVGNLVTASDIQISRYLVLSLEILDSLNGILTGLEEMGEKEAIKCILWTLSQLVVRDEEVLSALFEQSFKWGFEYLFSQLKALRHEASIFVLNFLKVCEPSHFLQFIYNKGLTKLCGLLKPAKGKELCLLLSLLRTIICSCDELSHSQRKAILSQFKENQGLQILHLKLLQKEEPLFIFTKKLVKKVKELEEEESRMNESINL